MIENISYEVARERMAEIDRFAAQARLWKEAKQQRRTAPVRPFGARDLVARVFGRFGWQTTQAVRG